MPLYDTADLEEAMNAIKEEIIKDLSESVLNENSRSDISLDSLDIS